MSDIEETPDLFADVRLRHLWGTFIFCIGSSMVGIVSSYLIYQQSESVAVTGLIVVCSSLPALLLPGPATYLARVWGGPKLYVYSRIAIGFVGLIPVVLSVKGDLTTASLLLWYLLTGILYALSGSATGLVRAMIAAPGKVPEFNGALGRFAAAGTIIGLLLGGGIYALVGSTWVFLFGALASMIEGLSVLRILKRAPIHSQPREPFRKGLAAIRSSVDMKAACIFSAWCFVVGGYVVTLPAIASSIGTNPEYLSVLQTASIVGGLGLGWAMAKAHGWVGWGHTQRICFFVFGLGMLLISLVLRQHGSAAFTLLAIALLLVPVGFTINMNITILGSIVQMFAPAGSRNSVMTAYAVIPAIFVPIGQEGIGFVADGLSVGSALGLLGAVVMGMLLIDPRRAMRLAIDTLDESTAPPPIPSAYVSEPDRPHTATD
ncbi:MAG: MFS transporter [Actinomycetes bacterium]